VEAVPSEGGHVSAHVASFVEGKDDSGMKEGWLGDEYLILFEGGESDTAADRYAVALALPGFDLIGLRGWDDFIVRDQNGNCFSVPTVPFDKKELAPFQMPSGAPNLQSDDRFTGRIKWYVKPVIFGGDPQIGDNLIWVSHEKHAELVRWWNELYRDITTPYSNP
jgi:hypothetical protein